MTNLERRSACRINDTLLLNYRLLNANQLEAAKQQTENFNLLEAAPFPMIAVEQLPTTVNLSTHGIAFATEDYFEIGSHIAITLMLGINAPPLHIIATVIDYMADPEGMTGYVRLKFETIAQYNRLRLANYTSHKAEQQQKTA